jgi:predicted HAD superfamily Cof-like phosphohydrolase
MRKQLQQVEEFHKAFGLFVADSPCIPEEKIRHLRTSLIAEEAVEVAVALEVEPLENKAKELADLLFVTYGTIISYGLQDIMEKIFDEVCKSNMSKLGKDGKPIYNNLGKVLKGPNYIPADIKSLLNH